MNNGIHRLGSIVADYDIIYDSTSEDFEHSLVKASMDLALGSNLTYDGVSVAAKSGGWSASSCMFTRSVLFS